MKGCAGVGRGVMECEGVVCRSVKECVKEVVCRSVKECEGVV